MVLEEYRAFENKIRRFAKDNAIQKRVVFELEQAVHCDRIVDRLIRPKVKGLVQKWKKNQNELEKKLVLERYLDQSIEQAEVELL